MGEIFSQEKSCDTLAFTGERFTSATGGQIEIEHLHRYYLARHLCRDCDVLDVACGEGYGSALLAQVARSVLGVDAAEDALSHAARNYDRPNLTFRVGDACKMPAADGSIDRVISFETIEHFYDHTSFLREIKRVLRPGGLMMLSTPERDIYSPPDQGANPHHVHELTRREFYDLMRQNFRHVQMFAQRPMLGSAIMSDQVQPHADLPVVFEHRGEDRAEASIGLARGTYLICVASDSELAPHPESLFIQTSDMASLLPQREQLEELERLTEENAKIARQNAKIFADNEILHRENLLLRRENHYANRRNADLQAGRAAERQRIADHQAEINRLRYDIGLERVEIARELDRVAHEINLRDEAIADKHVAIEQELARRDAEMARRDAEIEAHRRHAETLHDTYFATIQKLRRRSLRRDLMQIRTRRAQLTRSAAAVAASPLFDAAWYYQTYPDVRATKQEAALHYVSSGANEGRDPGPGFSTMFYLRSYPDAVASEFNPLEHYEAHGRAAGRLTTPPAPVEAVAPPPATAPAVEVVAEGRGAAGEAQTAAVAAPVEAPHVVYVSGEPHTAGHLYRVLRYAETARELGYRATVLTVNQAEGVPKLIEAAAAVVIWRAEWNQAIDRLIDWTGKAGVPVLFDVDDLMFDPQLARTEVIDGIRSQHLTELEVRNMYTRIAQTLYASTFCSSPTAYLTGQLRRWAKPSFVMPNGFDAATWRVSRRAVRARASAPSDEILRIGYAGGSRTHQRDFAQAADAIARVLREGSDRRLVLFKIGEFECLDVEEFPALAGLDAQIEWREMVTLEELPWELARFDVNVVPLEVGNAFCESKSELKYFEAALVGVPTIASPTLAFRAAMRDGITGLLADGDEAWYAALTKLLGEEAGRRRMGSAAYHDVLWAYGPDGRREITRSVLEQVIHPGERAARAFEHDLSKLLRPPHAVPDVPPGEVVASYDAFGDAEVTIVVPLYNYQDFVLEALQSVNEQTLQCLDLVVVDDGSTDGSLAVVRSWLDRNADRFNRAVLVRNLRNSGLARTRNAGVAAAETPFVLPLDADNKLHPQCAELCLEAIQKTKAAFVYPSLKKFGDGFDLFSHDTYYPVSLAAGNFIDATALIRVSAWAAVGGYDHVEFGWEDYEFWCRCAERGLYGHHVEKILAFYRVHSGSMLHTTTDARANKQSLIADMKRRHGWILRNMGLEEPVSVTLNG